MAFLARGFHPNWQHAFQRFVDSYQNFPAGTPHRLYVIFKGYRDPEHLAEGQSFFKELPHVPIHTSDAGFGIGCYQRVAHDMREEFVCFLNTKSEILCANWLRNLEQNLVQPGVGLVGNTGSYESINHLFPEIAAFPNPHIRTNAFLVRRDLFSRIADSFDIRTPKDGWMFECGPEGLSQRVLREGLQLLVVDREGQGFEPSRWEVSKTYCTAGAAPLIGDDTYRSYLAADPATQREMAETVWGPAAEEARARASQRRRAEIRQRALMDRSVMGTLSRMLKRLLRALTTKRQYQTLRRHYRGDTNREHSPA